MSWLSAAPWRFSTSLKLSVPAAPAFAPLIVQAVSAVGPRSVSCARAAVEHDVDLMGRAGEVELDDEPVVQVAAAHRDGEVPVEGGLAEHGARAVVDELEHLRAAGVGDPERRIEGAAGRDGVAEVGGLERDRGEEVAPAAGIHSVVRPAGPQLRGRDEKTSGGLRRRFRRGGGHDVVRAVEVQVDGLAGEGGRRRPRVGYGEMNGRHRAGGIGGRRADDCGWLLVRREEHGEGGERQVGGEQQPRLEALELRPVPPGRRRIRAGAPPEAERAPHGARDRAARRRRVRRAWRRSWANWHARAPAWRSDFRPGRRRARSARRLPDPPASMPMACAPARPSLVEARRRASVALAYVRRPS